MTFEDDLREFRLLREKMKPQEKRLEELKVAIRAATKKRPALWAKGGKTIEVGGVTVTRTDLDPVPALDPLKFLERVGPEVFVDVCVLTKVTIDPTKSQAAIEQERLTVDDILDCLGDPPKPAAWTIGLAR